MPGYRGVGKKKFCDLCNGYMGHEYRESMEPRNYCKRCLETTRLGCHVVMVVLIAFVLSFILSLAT